MADEVTFGMQEVVERVVGHKAQKETVARRLLGWEPKRLDEAWKQDFKDELLALRAGKRGKLDDGAAFCRDITYSYLLTSGHHFNMPIPITENPLTLDSIPVRPGQEHVARHVFDGYNAAKAAWTNDDHQEFYEKVVIRNWHFQIGTTVTNPERTTGTPAAGQP